MRLLISRYVDTGKQYIGNGFLLSDDDNLIQFEFRTLELSRKNNKKNVSCIPIGDYKVKKRRSKKFGWHFHIQDVDNRDLILIHKGNYYTDIEGCVLVGDDIQYLNKDDEIDVVNSSKTMKKLLKKLPKEFNLTIVER